MIRTALRLSALAALQAGGAGPSYPTVAGPVVYDSRGEDIVDLTPKDRRPTIIVRTDSDTRNWTSGNGVRGHAPTRVIELRIEISVIAGAHDEDGNPIAVWPATDAGLEALLDLLEWQVDNALYGHSGWAPWFRDKWSREGWDSLPIFTSAEQGNVRLAAREIRLRVRAPDECAPKPIKAGEPVPASDLPPRLLEVFDTIAASGGGDLKTSAAQIRAALEARDLPAGEVHPLLTGVRFLMPEDATPDGEEPAIVLEAELQAEDLPQP